MIQQHTALHCNLIDLTAFLHPDTPVDDTNTHHSIVSYAAPSVTYCPIQPLLEVIKWQRAWPHKWDFVRGCFSSLLCLALHRWQGWSDQPLEEISGRNIGICLACVPRTEVHISQ